MRHAKKNPRHPSKKKSPGIPITKFKEYNIWRGMIARCHNPRNSSYPWYGARGIEVCSRWRLSFEDFLDDVGRRPSPKHSLDRINPEENYVSGNVRWATAKEQATNKRKNPLLEHDGRTLSLSQWAIEIGVDYNTLWYRINVGFWDIPRALGTPKNPTRPWMGLK